MTREAGTKITKSSEHKESDLLVNENTEQGRKNGTNNFKKKTRGTQGDKLTAWKQHNVQTINGDRKSNIKDY